MRQSRSYLIFFFLLQGLSLTGLASEKGLPKGWHNLIHYQETISGYKSEADGKDFFLAKNGKTDPVSEFKATIEALNDTQKIYGKLKAPAACVFTSRKLFLEKHGYHFPTVDCPDYEAWRAGLPVNKLSLVFAASYPNNPASMFGHTFLRLNGPGEGNALLDYAVNFAATTGSDGGVEFAVLGVFGGYEGHYSLAPYFIKVNEYNNSEARDLWEYPLNVSPGSIDLLLAHLWELESTNYFDYYFFDDNCSWQILRLLEASDPNLDLSSHAPFYIIPGETVQILSSQNLLGAPIYRPSLRREYVETIDPDMKELLRFRLEERKGELHNRQRYHALLAHHAANAATYQAPTIDPTQSRPDWGHPLRKLTLTQGDKFRRLSFRFAHHDLLDPDIGHEIWSSLDVLRAVVEQRENDFFFREVVLADVTSLHNLQGLGFEPSWLLKFGAMNPREFRCQKCLSAGIEAGLGLSQHNEKWLAGAFLVSRAQGMSPDRSGPWWGLGPRVMLGHQTSRSKLIVSFDKSFNHEGDLPLSAEVSAQLNLTKSLGLRANTLVQKENRPLESSMSLLFYF